MTDEELIARLLDWEEYDEGDINDAREAAANRIKELKADLAGGSFYQEKDIDALQDRLAAQASEIDRLRGELKRSLESLEGLLWAWNELSRAVPLLHNEPSAKSARAIVAELKGGKDE